MLQKYPKGKVGKYTKECSNQDCQEIIHYRRLGDFIEAKKRNSICQLCINKNTSKLYKGIGLQGHLKNKYGDEEGIKKFAALETKRKKSFKEYWDKNPEELAKLISKRNSYKSKFYYVGDLRCQGRNEKFFLENLIKE